MKMEKWKKWLRAAWMLSVAICISIIGNSVIIQAAEGDAVAEGEVAINEANFPDENFRNYVKEFDTDGNGILSVPEIAAVTKISLYEENIADLEGIKNFPNLRSLWCRFENLQELELSGMTNLSKVSCWGSESLTEMNVSGCSSLSEVSCWGNESLTEMNVSDCSSLTTLECHENKLQKLNVMDCKSLVELDCHGNKLQELDITGCSSLTTLECNDNKLQKLNITDFSNLTKLDCSRNELLELDVTDYRNLSNFYCNENHLKKLDVSWMEKLGYLSCYANELQELNVTGCINLKGINCDRNHLKNINIDDCSNLTSLSCRDNELQEVNVDNCEKLQSLSCDYNELRELDVNNCEKLQSLSCDCNDLQELDVTNCDLTFLSCKFNNLTELDLTGLGSFDVYAEGNYIDEEKDANEYPNTWYVFPMKKYTFMGDFSKATNTIPYTDLGINLHKRDLYMGDNVIEVVSFNRLNEVFEAEGMTYSDEEEAFYVEPFEKEKTVSFKYCRNYTTEPEHTVEMRLINMTFTDIQTKDWFFEPVAYVNENDLMTGMNETMFAPADTLARAQFAVILHRMNGKPAMEYTERFPDVEKGIWYTDAVLWASQAKVVNGYSSNGYFGPADKITREQMAAMMYRYAYFKGYDTSARKELDAFKDAAKVNAYALDAMQWAVGNEIITGKTIAGQLLLDPEGYANRAECAAIIMRFTEKYKE